LEKGFADQSSLSRQLLQQQQQQNDLREFLGGVNEEEEEEGGEEGMAGGRSQRASSFLARERLGGGMDGFRVHEQQMYREMEGKEWQQQQQQQRFHEEQEEKLLFWKDRAGELQQECNELREAVLEARTTATATAATTALTAPAAPAADLLSLEALQLRIQEEEALRIAQARRMRVLAAKIGAGEVDVGGEGFRLLGVDEGEGGEGREGREEEEEEEELPVGVGEVLDSVSRWAALWKARAWEEVKAEVRELEELRRRDDGISSSSSSSSSSTSCMHTVGVQTDISQNKEEEEEEESMASSAAAWRQQQQQLTWQHELEIAQWQARVTSLEGDLQQQRRLVEEAVEEARVKKEEHQQALEKVEMAHEKEKERAAAAATAAAGLVQARVRREEEQEEEQEGREAETAVMVAEALSGAKLEWAQEEQRRLQHVYSTFDQEKAVKEQRWREKLQEVGPKVKFLQGAFATLSAKAKEKEREAMQAAQVLLDRQGREEELRARLERVGRKMLLKDVKIREFAETLRRQQKETMARATAAREATAAEVEKVRKEMSVEHEKEIDVVLTSVRKHMREKYKAKVLGMQQAWEEEKQALLFHQHGGGGSRKRSTAAAAAASFSVAAASVSRGGASHVSSWKVAPLR